MEDLNIDTTIYSPRHLKPLHKNLTSNSQNELATKKDKPIREVVNTFISAVPDHTKRSFKHIYDKVHNKFLEIKRKKKENNIEQHQKKEFRKNVFVTRSSIEYEKLKDEEKILERPLAYPITSATVLALPYAFKESGFPLGLILLIVVTIMVDYSEVLLVQCSFLAEDICLQRIAKDLFGLSGSVISYGMPCLLSLSVLIVYNIILADTFTKFLNATFQLLNLTTVVDRRVALLLLTIIIIPVSTTTNIKRIFRWSLVSLVSATFVMVLVTVKWFTLNYKTPLISESSKFLNINVLKSVGVITFVVFCQHTCRLCYVTIDQTRDMSANKPANIASSYSLLCTIMLAVFGYLTFKSNAHTNILENYCEGDIFAMIARLFVSIFALCLFPLECDNMRHLIKQVVIVHKQFQSGFNFIVTLLVLLPPFIVALFIDCLSLVLSLSGLILAVPLVFLLPSIFFLQLSPGKISSTKKLPCLVCIAIGSTVTVCGITLEVFAQQTSSNSPPRTLPYCNDTNDLLGPQITLTSLNNASTYG